jgi:hypothetical protein
MSVTLGPIEVLVIAFPESQFNGKIIPEIRKLVEDKVINLVDGMLVSKGPDGDLIVIEFEQPQEDATAAEFQSLMGEIVVDLVSTDDIDEFAKNLNPGDSAVVLVFEHIWAKPVRDAIVDSGGFLLSNLRVPGSVVTEVLNALDEEI